MVEVNGCHWCGEPARGHANLWHPVTGWHTWQAPTPEQRRERVADRLERLRQHASMYEQEVDHDVALDA
jgi:hypothetical protein